MYKELKHNLIGFGCFLAKSPSLGDPCGLYKWCLTLHLGFWSWKKCWHSGIRIGKGNY